MKIELYLVPEDIHGKTLKLFLDQNKIHYKEIIVTDISLLKKIAQIEMQEKMSLLKITKSGSISVINGFNEVALNQLLEHIKKYNPKIE